MDVTSLLENVGASATGSIISKLACYPLDTIAVQYQTSTRRPLLSIPLRSYYRGIGVTLLTVTPATALYLTAREAAQHALFPHLGDSSLNDAASGVLAELAGSVLFTPMEVLKARLQISRSGQEGKLLYQLRKIAKKEGFRGFYRGYVMGIASYVPFNVIWWTTYGNIRRSKYMEDKTPMLQIACGAGSAATVSAAFIHPLELVKTRYQVATSDTVAAAGTVKGSRNSDQQGLRQVAKNVMRENGARGFYAGFVPTVMRSVPSSIIMMGVFEHLKARRQNGAEAPL
ncbi:mitochondrial carrier domain-containing protein [Amylocarpus encephaloides]|uniref:Mitochondrial carrier domain-containing protein n=1 Tax=Amylocarpus encephaloides TaxID=45428 RepID=A0A9P7YJ64_9HELO|nr:mitochondrial carrier domain-containing protein [Amylocarpus encephaloides]